MSIKSLGLSLWNVAGSRSSSISSKRDSQTTTPVGGFGLPSPEDPDPFGVKALEEAGLAIKEAGTSVQPSIDAFEYRPSPTSPAFRLSTQSLDGVTLGDSRRNSRRNSKRNSKRSLLSIKTDQGSQTEARNTPTSPPLLPPRGASPSESIPSRGSVSSATFAIDAGIVQDPETVAPPSRTLSLLSIQRHVPETINEHEEEENEDEDKGEVSDLDEEEDIIIAQAPTTFTVTMPVRIATPIMGRAKVVDIKRRGPPALPLKSPLRPRLYGSAEDILAEDQDEFSSAYSGTPDKSAFDKSEHSPNPWSEQTSLQDNESLRHKDSIIEGMSLADPEESSKEDPKEFLKDVKEMTPIATMPDAVLPWFDGATDASKREATVSVTATPDLGHPVNKSAVTSQDNEPATDVNSASQPSENKLAVETSTITSSTMTPSESTIATPAEPSSEPSLESLIKQGLFVGLGEDDNEDDDASNYGDDISPLDSHQVHDH